MSSALSNQSFVRDEASYEELYPSGYRDPNDLSERSPSVSSPSLKNEDMKLAEPEEGSDDGEKQRIKSVVGTDELREFVMLPEWTINSFTSTIKETHFKTLRANYQIPEYIPIRLPYKSEKCYYEGVEGVRVYKQVLKVGLRFPLNSLHHELLKYLGLSISQISPNAWRVCIAMEVLYEAMSNDARSLTVREFLHCYRPDEIDKSKGMYSFIPRKSVLKVIYETPDSLKSSMKPRTPTVTERAVTSSWRATVGCVTQGRRNICQLTKLGEYWIRPVYIPVTLCM